MQEPGIQRSCCSPVACLDTQIWTQRSTSGRASNAQGRPDKISRLLQGQGLFAKEPERKIDPWLTSLLPLPKPLITGPESLIGNGASGPESGPANGSRAPSGRIFVGLC
jgi:hypothetical protein